MKDAAAGVTIVVGIVVSVLTGASPQKIPSFATYFLLWQKIFHVCNKIHHTKKRTGNETILCGKLIKEM